MRGVAKAQRVAVAALLILLVPLGGHVEALPLSIVVAALLTALAVWELRAPPALSPKAHDSNVVAPLATARSDLD